MILRASDWQIATWTGGNNRLTLKFISQTVHYVRSEVRWGEYFGTELYSMMSPSWELQCEMNFNFKVFTQRGERRRRKKNKKQQPALSYLKSQRENYTPHYRSKSQIQLPLHFNFTKQIYLIFILRHNHGCVQTRVTHTDLLSHGRVDAGGRHFDML